jgi:hypothetical protein
MLLFGKQARRNFWRNRIGSKGSGYNDFKKLVTFVWYLGDGINKRHPLMRLMQALLDTVTDAMKK